MVFYSRNIMFLINLLVLEIKGREIYKIELVGEKKHAINKYIGHMVSTPNKLGVSKLPDSFEILTLAESLEKDKADSLGKSAIERVDELRKRRELERIIADKDELQDKDSQENSKEKESEKNKKKSERKSSKEQDSDDETLERLEQLWTMMEVDPDGKLEYLRKNFDNERVYIKLVHDYSKRLERLQESTKSNETRDLLNGKEGEKVFSIGSEIKSDAIPEMEKEQKGNDSKKTGKEEKRDTEMNANLKGDLTETFFRNEFLILEEPSRLSLKQQFSLVPKGEFFKLMNYKGECLAVSDYDLYFTSCDKAVKLKISLNKENRSIEPAIRKNPRREMKKTERALEKDLSAVDHHEKNLEEKRDQVLEKEKAIEGKRSDPENIDPSIQDKSGKNLTEMRMKLDSEIVANQDKKIGLGARKTLADKIEKANNPK